MEARLLLSSDDANGNSGHGSDEGWEGQPGLEGGGSGTGLKARLH